MTVTHLGFRKRKWSMLENKELHNPLLLGLINKIMQISPMQIRLRLFHLTAALSSQGDVSDSFPGAPCSICYPSCKSELVSSFIKSQRTSKKLVPGIWKSHKARSLSLTHKHTHTHTHTHTHGDTWALWRRLQFLPWRFTVFLLGTPSLILDSNGNSLFKMALSWLAEVSAWCMGIYDPLLQQRVDLKLPSLLPSLLVPWERKILKPSALKLI